MSIGMHLSLNRGLEAKDGPCAPLCPADTSGQIIKVACYDFIKKGKVEITRGSNSYSRYCGPAADRPFGRAYH